jgi:dipeptidyl aminopeptidase/acylaminoacyl peptidase
MTSAAYLDALLTLPDLRLPMVSWDGRWVAWVWFRAGPAADVYAAPTDGSIAPLRLTATPDDTSLVSWTPDSRAVLVRQDRGGNERAQLFRVDLHRPLDLHPLTEPEPNYYLRGGHLHPNGCWLVYGANLDVATGREIEPTWIYRHDLETGERRVLARPQKAAYVWPVLSPAGTHLLYTRADRHPAGRQIWLVDIDGQEDREILNFGADVKTFASWFPDSRRIVLLAESRTHRRLGVWELDGGRLQWLLDDPGRCIENAYVPHGSEQIVIVESRQARVHSSLLDLATGQEIHLPAGAGNLVPVAPVGDGTWVGEHYSSCQPADLVRFDPADPRPERFASLSRVWERTRLAPEDLTPAEDRRWPSVDGLEIQGWFYRPRGPARGTVVHVHGGPTAHSEDEIHIGIQFLVHEGFNVLSPNYRGSTGFGLPFRDAIKVDGWGGREQDDIRAGIEALFAAGIASPGQVGITGTSYGGYCAWCAITHWPPEIVAAAAPVCGMTDLVVDYETTRPDLRRYAEEMMGGSPAQARERYYERSPVHFVERIKGRLLIVQGLQDPNVTPRNARAVRRALERAGVRYDLLTFADEGHGILKPRNQRTLYLRLAAFFAASWSAPGTPHPGAGAGPRSAPARRCPPAGAPRADRE